MPDGRISQVRFKSWHLVREPSHPVWGYQSAIWAVAHRLCRLVWKILHVLERKSDGWHDITVWVQGGGIQPGYEADLPFDGKSYATNPTVPPAHRLSPKTAGRMVISDKAIGTPLD